MTERPARFGNRHTRHVLASFHNIGLFEDAIDLLAQMSVLRRQIAMMASHQTVRVHLAQLYAGTEEPDDGTELLTPLFADRHDITEGRTLAIGAPVYVGTTTTGQPIVTTKGPLALSLAATMRGTDFDKGLASLLPGRHASYLADELENGSILLGTVVSDTNQEDLVTYLLRKAGGLEVRAHSIAWPEPARPARHVGHFAARALPSRLHIG